MKSVLDGFGRVMTLLQHLSGGYGAPRRGRNLPFTFVLALSVAAAPVFAPTAGAEPSPLTLVALGDSLTQGYGLPIEDGFVPQLQHWLAAKGHVVEVINAGVSGDTTAGGAARMAWTLADTPDAMIVTLGGNDLLRGIAPEVSRANLAQILSAARAEGVKVLLVAMEAPGNYGPEYRADFDGIYAELAEEHGALLGASFLRPLVEGQSGATLMRDLMQDDGIHPNAEGVRRIVEGLGPRVIELLSQVNPVD